MLIDSHCHLLYPDLIDGEGGMDGVLARAKAAGVNGVVNICCDPNKEWEGTQKLISSFDTIWTSYGVHPHQSGDYPTICAADFKPYAQHKKVIAIGECGLDYYYDHSPRDIQRTVFEQQVQAALENDIPLVIHSRDAEDDTLAILRAGGPKLRGVIHCFTGSQKLADGALEIGFYISASGIMTFKSADDLRAVFKTVPLDRLIVETDGPFLAPLPYRGKKNQPSFMPETVRALAALKNQPYEAFCAQTTANFFTLFPKAHMHDAA